MSPPHGKRTLGAHARLTRPGASKRNSGHGVPKAKSVQAKTEEPDDDIMATGFIPYCTFCERQIAAPSSTILYCSENCRKRDKSKSLSYSSASTNQSPPLTPLSTFSFEELPVRDIVPQRSPTSLANNRYSYSSLSDDIAHFSEDDKRPALSSRDSDAARYLRSFHSAEAQAELVSRTPRPRCNRSSTSTSRMSLTPSLSQSPTSTDPISMPYTPSTRPLPPRYNPFSSSYGTRTIDLVDPFASLQHRAPTTAPSSLTYTYTRPVSAISTDASEVEATYQKHDSLLPGDPTQGSLKQLFRFAEMQAPPAYSGP